MKASPRLYPVAIASILLLCQGVSAVGAVRSTVATDSFVRIGKQVVDDRQRHRYDPWAKYNAEQRRRVQQQQEQAEQKKKEADAAKSRAEHERIEDEWDNLQSRYNAIDVSAALEQAKADFCTATNLFKGAESPEYIAHTNSMVKLTRQLLIEQKQAKACFNRNLVLSNVKPMVDRFENAHKALLREIDSFSVQCSIRRSWIRVEKLYGKPATNEVTTIQSTRSTLSAADKLRELKKLFDEGVLTQEEYDEKRKELLSTY